MKTKHTTHSQSSVPMAHSEQELETEKLITGKNVNSVYHICPKHGVSIDMPLQYECEDCKLYLSGADIRQIIQSEREKSFASEKLRLCEVLEDLLHYQYSLPVDNSDGFKNVVPSKVIQMKLAKLAQKEESK